MKKGNQEFITILYGLAVVLLILGHSHPLHVEYPAYMHAITDFIYAFHMPLFFFIAGLLIAYSADGRNVWQWWKKKARKLLIPYVVLTLVAWIPKTILGSYMTDNMQVSLLNIIRILLIPREGVWGHFWFIPVYLILSLLCAAFYKFLMDKAPWNKFAGGGLIIGIMLSLNPIPTRWFGIRDLSIEFIYVVLGMICSNRIISNKERICKWYLMLLGTALAVFVFVMVDNRIASKVVSVLMLYMILSLSILLSKRSVKQIKMIGKHAFTIYIYSWPIQAVVEFVLAIILKFSWYLIYPCMFITGLLGPLILYELYIRFLPGNGFLDAMLGAKNERHIR